MKYAEKLMDERWKKRRDEIVSRDGGKCQHCGSDEHLQVHHKNYIQKLEPWDYPDSLLQTLCRQCHGTLIGHRHGAVDLSENGFSYDGKCPMCGSANIKEKGSYDKCDQCGHRISYYP